MVSMAFVIASAQIAPPAHAEPTPPKPVAAPASTDPAIKIDTEAVAEAAEQYSPGNATDAAELADAAATQEAVPVKPTLTGMVAEPILGRDGKLATLRDMAAKRGIGLDRTLAVGDGANDLAMLEVSGLGVAYRAKPAVAAAAHARIDHGDLTALLYAQGYRRDEFVDA